MLTACQDRRVIVWDIRAPQPVREIAQAHPMEVGCITAAPSGTSFATGGLEGVVKLWDIATGAVVAQGAGHTSGVSKIVFPVSSGAGQPMASVAMDGSIANWQLA